MRFFLAILVLLVTSCTETDQAATKKTVEEKTQKKEKIIEFLHYSTVTQMLKSAGDYKEKNGTLKVLSKEKEIPHVQVSNWVFEGDTKELMVEQTKRDIIYLAFQTFAETDIDEIVITSVPLKMKDFKNRDKYLEEYKNTKTIKREEARTIMNKYLYTTDFKALYEFKNGEMWLPNKKFSDLRFKYLDKVFSELK